MTRLLFNRRIARAWIGAALLVACCLLRAAPAGATTFQPMNWTPGETVVSLEFDDGSADQYQVGSMLAGHNMKGTFFVNSGLEINSYHMTWSQIHDLYSQGNEIAGHTVLHADLATLPSDEAAREICNDRDTLLNEGFPVTDFAYPHGSNTSAIVSQVEQCGYNSARIVTGIRSAACEGRQLPLCRIDPAAGSLCHPHAAEHPRHRHACNHRGLRDSGPAARRRLGAAGLPPHLRRVRPIRDHAVELVRVP